MESQDLTDSVLARKIAPNIVFNEEEVKDESSSIRESDSTDGNITMIRVCPSNAECQQETSFKIPVSAKESPTEESDRTEINVLHSSLENRSCSPLSQDLRSQDSGFSDSERSNCSEGYENQTPRRRRRKKLRERRRMHARTGPLWPEAGIAPTCTSTPKETRPSGVQNLPFKVKADDYLQKSERIGESTRNAPTPSSVISLADESLGDFLYASEPAEDSVEARPTKSTLDYSTEKELTFRSIVDSRSYRQSAPVRTWLGELGMITENECGITLQSKSLPRRKHNDLAPHDAQMKDLRILSSLATAAATKLLTRADQFDGHYRFIVEKLSHLQNSRPEKDLLRAIEEDAFSILSELGAPPPRRVQQSSLKGILVQLENMKGYVDSVLNMRLDFYIEKIVRGLEEAPKEDSSIARGSLAALTALGLAGPRAGSSIARCCGIRALLTALISAKRTCRDFVAASLRALASVCSSSTSIEQFVTDGGPEIVTDLLAAESTSEKEKMEATALVVQITAPWTEAVGLPHLEPYISSLVSSLTCLVENTGCSQTLLLAAAALNQLSKLKRCVYEILEQDTVRKLLISVKKSGRENVWLMEQVASLIGVLARYPVAQPHLAKARASVALVCFLRMRPPGLEDAYRRLEITAAAALIRLCVDPEIARQVVAVGGADCLPSCSVDALDEDEAQVEAGLLRYTKSVRRACKKAAKQIGIAKAYDQSAFG